MLDTGGKLFGRSDVHPFGIAGNVRGSDIGGTQSTHKHTDAHAHREREEGLKHTQTIVHTRVGTFECSQQNHLTGVDATPSSERSVSYLHQRRQQRLRFAPRTPGGRKHLQQGFAGRSHWFRAGGGGVAEAANHNSKAFGRGLGAVGTCGRGCAAAGMHTQRGGVQLSVPLPGQV